MELDFLGYEPEVYPVDIREVGKCLVRGIRLASVKHGVDGQAQNRKMLNDGGDHGNGGSGDREERTRLSMWQDTEK